MNLPLPRPVFALLLTLALPVLVGAKQSFIEDFTTTAYKDTLNTTADWDTTAGELRLFPLPAFDGAYDTPGYAWRVAVDGSHLFVADGQPGLLILDVTQPTNPTLLGSYATSGAYYDVAVAGNLAFAADYVNGLHVLDITDPANPTLIGAYATPGNGRGVAVDGNLAFVADNLGGLQIIDVSDPTNPVLAGSYDTPDRSLGVAVDGDLAFVADNTGGLQIIDISDPTNPVLAGAYATPGYCNYVAVAGDLAVVANGTNGILIIDVSDPANPVLAGSCDTPGDALGVRVAGDLVFVADRAAGLQEVDISDPQNPILVRSYQTPDEAWGLAVDGNLAFVGARYSGIQVLDIADHTPFAVTGTRDTPWIAQDVAVAGDFAFVADDAGGLQVIDISNRANPIVAGAYDTPDHALGVCVRGNLAFVADASSGLQIIDVSDPTNPVLAGNYPTPVSAFDVTVSGNLAFIAASNDGLLIVDITDPANPTYVGGFNTPGTAERVTVAGNLAFVADGTGGLQIIDIHDPVAPVQVGVVPAVYYTWDVAVAGDLACVADQLGGLEVVDISDPADPFQISALTDAGVVLRVSISGYYAFILDGSGSLAKVRISTPATPQIFDYIAMPYPGTGVVGGLDVLHGFVFVADGGGGLQVVRTNQYEFQSSHRNQGRSLAMDDGQDLIVRARVSSSESPSVLWWLSDIDKNGNWRSQGVPTDVWERLDYPGTDLSWTAKLAWADPGVDPTVFGVRVDWLNEYAPITAVTDVPNDQGGRVYLHFTRSGYDFPDATPSPIEGYNIYRRVDGISSALETTDPVLLTGSESIRTPTGSRAFIPAGSLARQAGGRSYFSSATAGTFPPGTWALVGSMFAAQIDSYLVEVATDGDSTAAGIDWSVYLVTAHTTTPSIWFSSTPDSGYSLDNIAPGVPQQFTASYVPSGVALSWDPAPEPDFQYFRVYRSTDPGFVPGPGTLVQETASTSWQDSPADPTSVVYKLTALDYAGNESDPASSGSVVAARPASPTVFALQAAHPNPLRSHTRIVFDLPVEAFVSLEIFDVAGRRVRTLVRRNLPPGAHEVTWDGADGNGGQVAAGIYLYRLRAGTFEATRRMVLTR